MTDPDPKSMAAEDVDDMTLWDLVSTEWHNVRTTTLRAAIASRIERAQRYRNGGDPESAEFIMREEVEFLRGRLRARGEK